MKKRSCARFHIPGTTLYYRQPSFFSLNRRFSVSYYPVANVSLGGARFLCNERLKVGRRLDIKLAVPGHPDEIVIRAHVSWVARNKEQSYQYQTGIAFCSYGKKKSENPEAVLSFLKALETQVLDSESD